MQPPVTFMFELCELLAKWLPQLHSWTSVGPHCVMNLGRPGSPRTWVFSSLQSERNSLTASVNATPFCCCCFVFGNRVSLCYPYLSRNLIFKPVCWLVSTSTWHKVESFWKNVLEPRKLLALRRQKHECLEVQGQSGLQREFQGHTEKLSWKTRNKTKQSRPWETSQ